MTVSDAATDAAMLAYADSGSPASQPGTWGDVAAFRDAMQAALEAALPHLQGRLLGYVIANEGAERPAYLSHTSVATERADAEREAHDFQRNKGENYTVCELRPATDPFTPPDPSPEGEPE